MPKQLENDIEILVGQVDQNSKILFWSVTQELLDLLKF